MMNVPFSALYDTSGAPVEVNVLDVGNALLFSKQQLEQTPSRKEGIGSELENKLRLKGCEIIHGVLTLCGVDRTVICTAHVYLHRYYCQRSITAFNYKYVALGVIYLALKTEETNITEDELIPVFCRFLERAYLPENRQSDDIGWVLGRSSEFDLWWDWLVCLEMDILIAFGFRMHVARPHKLMFTYMQKLELTDLMQDAWIILNDSYLTTACVRYKSEDLACGSIFYVAQKEKISLPENGKYPWWELFGASKVELHEFALVMHEFYNRPEEDFDFTSEVDVEYKNERADGLKRPHPALLFAPSLEDQTTVAMDLDTDTVQREPEPVGSPQGENRRHTEKKAEGEEERAHTRHDSDRRHRRHDSRERSHRKSRHHGEPRRHRRRHSRSDRDSERHRRHHYSTLRQSNVL